MKISFVFAAFVSLGLALVVNASSASAQGTRPQGNIMIESSDDITRLEIVFYMGSVSTGETQGENMTRIRVTNFAKVDATNLVGVILNPHYHFHNGPYPGETGTCGKTLAAGATCTIAVSFKPKSPGLKRGLVRINYWEGSVPSTSYRPLTGEGLL